MTTWDALVFVVLGVWFVFFRKKYDWKAVLLFYFLGVMFADFCCAALLVVFRHDIAPLLRAGALLMPLGGLGGLGYGIGSKKIGKVTGLVRKDAAERADGANAAPPNGVH